MAEPSAPREAQGREWEDEIHALECANRALEQELGEHVRRERRLSIQYTVALALSEAQTLAEAVPKLLQAVCDGLDWARAECWCAHWAVRGPATRLHCVATAQSAHAAPDAYAAFDAATCAITFGPGEGLPGRVWVSGKPEWTPDVIQDGFARVAMAAEVGLRAAFAVPVKVGDEVLGVMVFLDGDVRPPDPEQFYVLEALGHQVGQFVERKRAEEAAVAKEQRFRALIEKSMDAIVLLDAGGAALHRSPSAERVFGYTDAETIGRHFAEFIHPAELPQAQTLFAQLVQTPGASSGMEFRYRHKDGDWHCVEATATNWLANPPIGAVVVNLRDITERKRAEQIRRESEARFRAFTEATSEGVVFHDNGVIVDVNPAAAAMFGYTVAETVGRNLLEFVAPESRELVLSQMRAGSTQLYEARGLRKDGTVFPVEAAARQYDYAGRRLRVASLRDITQRKQAAQALKESEERFTSAFNASPAGIAISALEDGRIIDANPGLLGILGYARDEIIGRAAPELNLWAYPADRAAVIQTLKQAGRAHNLELQARTKSGEIRDVLASIELIWLGGARCMLSVVHDITQIKRAEQETRLLQTIALGVSGARDLDTTIRNILRLVCEATDWVMGEAWAPSADGARLELHPAWYGRVAGLEAFRATSAAYTFAPGVGLPGRAWQTRAPVWSQDVTADPEFPRAELARQAGIKTAVGVPVLGTAAARQAGLRAAVSIPVLVGDQVMLVLVFFQHEPRVQDPRLIQLIASIAAELGVVIERKRAQEALEESEHKFALLFDKTIFPVALARLADGVITNANEAFEKALELARGAAIGKTTRELGIQITAAQRQQIAREFQAQGALRDVELTLQTRSGRQCVFMTNMDRVQLGDQAYILYTIQDITARKRAEDALAAERALLRTLVDNLPVSIYVKDPAGRKTLANPANLQRVGATVEADVLGKTDFELYPADLAAAFAADDQRVLQTGRPVLDREEQFTRPDGSRGWQLTAKVPLQDHAGQVVGLIGIGHDITERKRMEEQLRATLASLERSNADLERFAWIASHDLQEPLRMVSSYVQLLARNYQGRLDADADEFIGYAVEGVGRMRQLLLDLLDYSRLGSSSPARRPVDAHLAVQAALYQLEDVIAQAQADITCDPLPTVLADAGQLAQLFLHLIANAIKFHGAAPPRVHITARETFEAAPSARVYEFAVRDNGIGIEPLYFERIFVIFQRLNKRSEYPGNGIGLAICKRIVELHGGRIWIESTPGQGSTFCFTLPA